MNVPLYKMIWSKEDISSITSVIKRGNFWAVGPEIEDLEKRVADFSGRKHCLAFCNGTAALHAMMLAYDIKQGDEVIVPSFTFISTANSVAFVGAKPVFADIEDKTYGLDIESVKEKITTKTKAITVVHYAGCPAYYTKALKDLAEDHKLLFFEDAAESMGARIYGDHTGSFGNCGMYSLCQTKVITSGEGGLLVLDDDKIYEKLKLIRSHGRKDDEYIYLGYNFRMPTICAALAISQLKDIYIYSNKRRKLAERYIHKLHRYININRPPINPYFHHVFQMMPIEVNDRDNLMKYLLDNGISTKPYFDPPVHLTPLYYDKRIKLPVTEKISKRILNIPLYPSLTFKEVDYVADKIKEYYK